MLVVLARRDKWMQSLLKQVGSILNDPRTEKNPRAPPNCEYVEVDDRQGFQHPVPKGCDAGIHAGRGFVTKHVLLSTVTDTRKGAELTALYGRTFDCIKGGFEGGDRQGMQGTTGKVCVCARAMRGTRSEHGCVCVRAMRVTTSDRTVAIFPRACYPFPDCYWATVQVGH